MSETCVKKQKKYTSWSSHTINNWNQETELLTAGTVTEWNERKWKHAFILYDITSMYTNLPRDEAVNITQINSSIQVLYP